MIIMERFQPPTRAICKLPAATVTLTQHNVRRYVVSVKLVAYHLVTSFVKKRSASG
jgi:hypothetical protein